MMFKIISSELFNKVWSKWWTGFKEIHSHGLSQLPSAGRFSHLYWQSRLAGSHFALLLSFLPKCWFFFFLLPFHFSFFIKKFYHKTQHFRSLLIRIYLTIHTILWQEKNFKEYNAFHWTVQWQHNSQNFLRTLIYLSGYNLGNVMAMQRT